jgi:hypothetical protein
MILTILLQLPSAALNGRFDYAQRPKKWWLSAAEATVKSATKVKFSPFFINS